ncbi:hypothetical protein [Paenibacillus sp. FJAT-26967]|uniref:hypothetical protein n=1 Tax=Paenibacillus sp. FJAT-26967 TaxID=1729690 RepID=UPI0012E3C9A8|nr:hypothetical protein [Paenibacillus sp. FJAT-26967]
MMDWSLDLPMLILALGFTCWWLSEWFYTAPPMPAYGVTPLIRTPYSSIPAVLRTVGSRSSLIRRKIPSRQSDENDDETDSSHVDGYRAPRHSITYSGRNSYDILTTGRLYSRRRNEDFIFIHP